jgi:shikimate 5-dehydrogenase
VIIDLAYGTNPTPLVSGILARGGTVVDGYDVLLSQVRKQFRLMVGKEMPDVIGRELADRAPRELEWERCAHGGDGPDVSMNCQR